METINILNVTKNWGTPCYLFRTDDFCTNFKKLVDSFRKYYPNYIPAYSYKTNYTPFICKLVKQMGGYAEVVSDMELYLAQKLGYKAHQIIYNGPNKGSMLDNHILNGGISNIDSICEAKRIKKLANQNSNTIIKVGLRLNVDIGAGFVSRFGIDTQSNDVQTVMSILQNCPNIKVVGLHLHVSRARGIDAWKKRINSILGIADDIIKGIPEYIDVGSGMFADMEDSLKQQFPIEVPTYEDYALVVANEMAVHYKNAQEKPILFTEPGTTVVSRYLSLITTVCGVKKVKEKNYAIVDSDIHNAGETCQFIKLPYTLIHVCISNDIIANPDIVGYTCLEQDCIYKGFPETVSIGDVIEFRNVGGYSIVYKPPFILPNCRVIATTNNGGFTEIKQSETFEDVFKTFIF